jgi:type I restriction enzyme S subunit
MGEWHKKPLETICIIKKGIQINRTELTDKGSYYVLNGGVELSGYHDRYNTEANTISISEGGNSCGYVALNKECFWSGGHNYTLSELAIDLDYLYQYLKYSEPCIMGLRVGTGLPNIQRKAINAFAIAYPDALAEQSKIAEVLATVDEAIDKTRAVIEKYTNIKAGMMQDLLGRGDEVMLCEILLIGHGKNQRQVEDSNGEYPILGSGGLMGYANRYLWDKPSVLIGRKGTIDEPQYMDTPFWTIDTLYYTIILFENSAKYFYYVFQTIPWRKYNEASGVPSLSSKTISKIKVKIVKDKTEQIKIVDQLTAADERIQTERDYLAKLQDIKRGMMHDLLTNTVSVDSLIQKER